ncbi:MAG: hypothetical protein Ct9H90mP13_06240 [Pseudomonadota bacterium]|nr:MAG: hypothetical protein Ct9H90mP13_06240 [Pseudomonadota bacterium]
MHINLPNDVKEWIKTAESFLEETKPWEVEAEMNSGKVPEEIDSKHRQMAIDLGYQAWTCQKALAEKNYPISNKSLFGKSWAEVQMP